MAPSYCVRERKPCVPWVEKYFKDCLCDLKDDFSFGLVSLVCWGVAEIPQIIINFHIDIFNLVGCLLKPATLYTTTTPVLVLQSLYYDYIYRWCRRSRQKTNKHEDEDAKKPLKPKPRDESGVPIPNGAHKTSPAPRREMIFYMSARSLAGSGTPPFRSYMRVAKSGSSALKLNSDSSSDNKVPVDSPSQPRPIPRSFAGGYGTFLAAAVHLPAQVNALAFTARRLLQPEHEVHSTLGQWLGWLMAAIYMEGRLPQIWFNINRGSVEYIYYRYMRKRWGRDDENDGEYKVASKSGAS